MNRAKAESRAARALTRRFGESAMPINFKDVDSKTIRATDPETGSFIECDISGDRIKVRREQDNA